MSDIDLECPECGAEFSVGPEFAGDRFPCPKCQTLVTVPEQWREEEELEEVTAGEGVRQASSAGHEPPHPAHVEPIHRREMHIDPATLGLIVGGLLLTCLLTFLVGYMLGPAQDMSTMVTALGVLLVSPPLVFAGYTILQDDELEPYRGRALLIRVAICSVSYIALWGVYTLLYPRFFPDPLSPPEIWHVLFVVPPLVAAGAGAAMATLDLDFGTACLHYSFYLLCTIALRLLLGLPAIAIYVPAPPGLPISS